MARFESFGFGGHERHYVLSALSGTAQFGPAQTRREPHSLSASAFLYVRLCAVDVARRSAVPSAVGARVGAADVRREEYDVRVGSAPRPLFDGVGDVPRSDEHERGRRANAQRPKQEQLVLRGMDPEQYQILGLRYSSARSEDERDIHRQYDGDSGRLRTRRGAVHGDVPPKSVSALVYGRGNG